MLRRAILLLTVLPMPLACAPPPPAAPPQASPATSTTASPRADDLAPIAYTADQIRQASQKGRRIELRLEVPGKPTVRHALEFTASDERGAEVTTTVLDEQGGTVSGPEAARATWEDLRKHGAFPRAATTITEARTTVPAGTFECTIYRVTKGSGADATVTTLHFAKTLPGPPVLFFTEKAGQRVMTSTMVANRPGAGP